MTFKEDESEDISKKDESEGCDDMLATAKKKSKLSLNVDMEKFKSKVPHLPVVNGTVQIDENNPLHRKWFEEFKK
ncbi:hypothetical protein ACTID9_14800 [Brevibacillus fluminis]|uniref:hypothetical protein n=1 Tax=Brevibacillus fluminis TaxID=511487 RepID=UPI003F88E7EC